MAVHTENKEENNIPNFKAGDTLKVFLKVVEGDSERIQAFEGVCIRRRGQGASETFTVRKISFGVGVERILPLNSPRIQKIQLMKSGKVRRAKLYYLRDLKGKAARLKEAENVAEASEAPVVSESPKPAAQPSPASEDAAKVEAAAA